MRSSPSSPAKASSPSREKFARDFDVAIIFPNSLRTALEAWLAGIPRRVGYPGHRRRWLLNQVFAPKKKKKAPRRAARTRSTTTSRSPSSSAPSGDLTGGADASRSDRRSPITDHVRRHRPLPRRGIRPGQALAARALRRSRCASSTQRRGCEWKLFGVEKDAPIADAIVSAADVPVHRPHRQDHARRSSSTSSATCDLLLTNDTGTMHLAAFLGVPIVAIFGSHRARAHRPARRRPPRPPAPRRVQPVLSPRVPDRLPLHESDRSPGSRRRHRIGADVRRMARSAAPCVANAAGHFVQ